MLELYLGSAFLEHFDLRAQSLLDVMLDTGMLSA